ncbi:MAG: hypothetical protein KGJ60_00300 [Verrucomicrobiota bacterium]|nr:hypothetical protein [Verrucomicrobiota bacterium]
MRTKTLLCAAGALAASLAVSSAQTVYSANVVGYVNVPITGGQYALLANPLDNGTNTLSSLFPNAPVGSTILVWTGTGYQSSGMGFGGTWSTNLVITPGEGFFANMASTITNTFVGNVAVAPGSSVTTPFSAGVYALVGSPIPYSDTLSGTNLNLQLGTGSTILVWTGSGFQSSGVGFGGTWSTNLTITPGEGFFVNSATATNWVQTFQTQ